MKLFKKLAAIHSASGREQAITAYIKRWVHSTTPKAVIEQDAIGNLYITKGNAETYPCVVAHLDQVQQAYPKDYTVAETADIIFGYSPSHRKQCGLGADDKCGIWIALKMLKKHDVIKIALFPGEEIGCVGSSKANLSFFNNVRFIVEPDRRGSSDLISNISCTSLCSKDFLAAINYEDFGYSPTNGLMTDVLELTERGVGVSCINMSCGYYSPHTEQEYVVKADMINALNLVDHIIANCVEVYPHTPEYAAPTYHSYYHSWFAAHSPKQKEDNAPFYYTESDAAEPKELDEETEYYNQFESAIEHLSFELTDNPSLTAESFLSIYGETYDMLDIDDIREIISDYID